jgi:hypothetical protein
MHKIYTTMFHQIGELMIGSNLDHSPPLFIKLTTLYRLSIATKNFIPPRHKKTLNLCDGAIFMPPMTKKIGEYTCHIKQSTPGLNVSWWFMAISIKANNIRGIISDIYPKRNAVGITRNHRNQVGRPTTFGNLNNFKKRIIIGVDTANTIRL